MNQETKFDPMFMQLVISLQAGAMQQMGKMASPVTGKVDRDLTAAKFSIDMLAMIESKTQGNLSEDEKQLVTGTLTQLRLNYVDELEKERKEEASAPETGDDQTGTEGAAGKDEASGENSSEEKAPGE